MARKVLISFLGTGPLEKAPDNSDKSKRRYKKAVYRIDGHDYERSFVADVLIDHFKINTVLMIGTVKSMWEELYSTFAKKRGENMDEDYWLNLAATSDSASSKSKLSIPNQTEIERVLGKDSHVILINYGLNEEELENNIKAILDVEQYLQSGDELYVDITHSFRSLPLVIMNILMYLRNVSKKKISIKMISYGMLEMTRELGYAPIVDLKKIIELNDWISGAYAFSEFGNAYKVASLLEDIDKSTAKRLEDFSNAKNINNMVALQNSAQQLSGIKFDNMPTIAKMTVEPIVKEFRRSIGQKDSLSRFQYNLAKWHRSKRNYYAAYLTLVEAIVSHVCEECNLDAKSKIHRNEAKDKIINEVEYKNLYNIYDSINILRNHLAHSVKIKENNKEIIDKLDNAIKELESYLM